MAGKTRRIFALLKLYAWMDFTWFTQDTFTCVLNIISDAVSSVASISGVFLLAVRFSGVGGLSSDAVLFMLGFYMLADGLTYLFSGNNVSSFSRRIGRGQVEHMMIQPVPLWMQLLTEGFMPVSGCSTFILGTLMTAIAASRLSLQITPLWLIMLIVYLLVRMAVFFSVNFLIGSAAFYSPVGSEEISSLATDLLQTLGRFPLSGIPSWAQGLLLTVLPAGLMAWYPALALLGITGGPVALLLPVCIAATLVTISTIVFQKGMKYYAKHGIARYRDLGHRG